MQDFSMSVLLYTFCTVYFIQISFSLVGRNVELKKLFCGKCSVYKVNDNISEEESFVKKGDRDHCRFILEILQIASSSKYRFR